MGMGNSDKFDVATFHAKLVQLADERFGATPMYRPWIGGSLAIRLGGKGVRETGIPQQPTLLVVYHVAVISEVHRLTDVHAGRPSGDVASYTFTAIQNVKLIHARGRLR
jgi:hypothetical protein